MKGINGMEERRKLKEEAVVGCRFLVLCFSGNWELGTGNWELGTVKGCGS